MIPGQEAFGRPAGDLGEQLAPVFKRLLRAAELAVDRPLVGGPIVAKMFEYDTDPAHNPQPPRQT